MHKERGNLRSSKNYTRFISATGSALNDWQTKTPKYWILCIDDLPAFLRIFTITREYLHFSMRIIYRWLIISVFLTQGSGHPPRHWASRDASPGCLHLRLASSRELQNRQKKVIPLSGHCRLQWLRRSNRLLDIRPVIVFIHLQNSDKINSKLPSDHSWNQTWPHPTLTGDLSVSIADSRHSWKFGTVNLALF